MFPQLPFGFQTNIRFFTAYGSVVLDTTDIQGTAGRSIFANGSTTLGNTDISGVATIGAPTTLSWATMTAQQWADLTAQQWSDLTP